LWKTFLEQKSTERQGDSSQPDSYATARRRFAASNGDGPYVAILNLSTSAGDDSAKPYFCKETEGRCDHFLLESGLANEVALSATVHPQQPAIPSQLAHIEENDKPFVTESPGG
jgi:hypothetical protein